MYSVSNSAAGRKGETETATATTTTKTTTETEEETERERQRHMSHRRVNAQTDRQTEATTTNKVEELVGVRCSEWPATKKSTTNVEERGVVCASSATDTAVQVHHYCHQHTQAGNDNCGDYGSGGGDDDSV
mgnify:CR=1 FL=1